MHINPPIYADMSTEELRISRDEAYRAILAIDAELAKRRTEQ